MKPLSTKSGLTLCGTCQKRPATWITGLGDYWQSPRRPELNDICEHCMAAGRLRGVHHWVWRWLRTWRTA